MELHEEDLYPILALIAVAVMILSSISLGVF